ncbi:MAG: hypothetical protein IKA58_01270, partial [Clostridia bacterium]|nr:hypothetical protein [Clostridia bacterium]
MRTRTCSVCGADQTEELELLPHSFGAYTSDNNATCVSDATETAQCTAPGCTATHVRALVGTHVGAEHTLEFLHASAASCTADGARSYRCKYCPHTESAVTAPRTGHSTSFWRVASREAAASSCTYVIHYEGVCGNCQQVCATKQESKTVHVYEASIVAAATCRQTGSKKLVCACGDEITQVSPIDLNAHHFIAEGEPASGVQKYTCDNNGCTAIKHMIAVSGSSHSLSKEGLGTNQVQLTVNAQKVYMQLDATALNQLEEGAVGLSVGVLNETDRAATVSKLTEAQRILLGEQPIYDFCLQQGEEAIHDFNGGSITVTLPYTLPAGADPDCVVVWFLADNGDVEMLPATYSSADETVTFAAKHFSLYAPAIVGNGDACRTNGHHFVSNGNRIGATCSAIGYTEMVCTRCGELSFGELVYELGHDFSGEPVTVAATCTVNGKYSYVCQRAGCSHSQDYPILAKHDWEYTEDYKDATCTENGYRVLRCRVCEERKTEILAASAEYHDTKITYAFQNGGDSCLDGWYRLYACQTPGCSYQQAEETVYYSHMDAGMEYAAEELDISAYFPALFAQYPSAKTTITLNRYRCPCGKPFARIEYYDEAYIFQGTGLSVYADENSILYTNPMEYSMEGYLYEGPGVPTVCKVVVRTYVEDEDCFRTMYADIMVGTGDAIRTITTYKMAEGARHTQAYRYELATPGTTCKEGVCQITTCTACEEELFRTPCRIPSGETHVFYTETVCAVDLSGASHANHVTYLNYQKCPCGQERYQMVTEQETWQDPKCSFTQSKNVSADGLTETIDYTCSCGVRYRAVQQHAYKDNKKCQSERYMQWFYGYDVATQSYTQSTKRCMTDRWQAHEGLPVATELPTAHGCYVSVSRTFYCRFCGVSTHGPFVTVEARHEEAVSTVADAMGNVTRTVTCHRCDYHSAEMRDADDTLLREYDVSFDFEKGTKTVILTNYRLL